MSYKAIVARVYTRPHPNADRLQLGECRGYQVIVGLDTPDGELGIFFPPDGQLSDAYVRGNDLYARDPETGEKGGGFFNKHRRVTAQRFRGEKSEGYWAPLDSLKNMAGVNFVEIDNLQEGDEIDAIGRVPLCRKYETPATRRAKAHNSSQARRANAYFAKHFDTEQLRRGVDDIPYGALIYFTEKLHGTSGRFGYVLEERERTWREKLAQIIAGYRHTEYKIWDYLLGTRNVILGQWTGNSYYGKEGFRYKLTDPLKGRLRKGEILYFEIVGFTDDGQAIMPAVDVPKELEQVRADYGKRMWYTYGNWEADSPASPRAFGGSEMYVYRIVQLDPDGIPRELTWEQVKARCEELGVQAVPQLIEEPLYYLGDNPRGYALHGQVSRKGLMHYAEDLAKGPSLLDDTHIREGVAIRWEKGNKMGILKHKSFEFLVLEGHIKAQEDYVDMEEAS